MILDFVQSRADITLQGIFLICQMISFPFPSIIFMALQPCAGLIASQREVGNPARTSQ